MSDLRLPELNHVVIAGRLTRDPELRYLASGTALCRASIANTRHYRKKDGERGEDTSFIDLVIWDKQAEFVGERLKKGRPVLVEGRLKSDRWEDKNTGQARTKVEIQVRRLTPLDWEEDGRGGGSGGGGGGGYESGPPQRQSEPQPRVIEEPSPEDDIPF